MKRAGHIVLLLLFCLPFLGKELHFKHIDINHGLSSNDISCIAQDADGFIWVGTKNGLNCYNSYDIINFFNKPDDPYSIPFNTISSIFSDSKKRFWIATEEGLCRYDKIKNRFISYFPDSNSKKQPHVNFFISIKEHTSLGLIFASEQGYFYRYNEKEDKLNRLFDIRYPGIKGFEIYKDSIFVVGTMENGFFLISAKSGKTIRQINGLLKNINCIHLSKNKLWIGTQKQGVQVIDLESFSNVTKNEIFENQYYINYITEDRDGNLWICSGSRLICHKKGQKSKSYNHSEANPLSLSSNIVSFFYVDSWGNYWVGTSKNGLNYAKKRDLFTNISNTGKASSVLSETIVSSIYEDYDGTIWVGYFTGNIDVLNPDLTLKKRIKHDPSSSNTLGKGTIFSLKRNNAGKIVYCTDQAGLQEYDDKRNKFTTIFPNPNFPVTETHPYIRDWMEDSEDNLWVATQGNGIYKYNYKTSVFKHIKSNYNDSLSLNSDWIFQIFESNNKNIWLATSAGASKYNKINNQFTNFYHSNNIRNSLSAYGINFVYQDKKSNIWLGSINGLNQYKPGNRNFDIYNAKNGFSGSNFLSILEDSRGRLWTSTLRSISMFVPETGEIRNFNFSDGIAPGEFFPRSACKLKSGHMLFGGTAGITLFHPDSVLSYNNFFPVFITDIKIFNRSINENAVNSKMSKLFFERKKLKLEYSQNHLSIDFVALNYEKPKNSIFKYKLHGIDKEWNITKDNRRAAYVNLPSGNYLFQLGVVDDNGNWLSAPDGFVLEIAPPFWRAWWAYPIYIFLVFLLILAYRNTVIYRERFRKELEIKELEAKNLKEISQVKYRFYTNLSHELKTPISLILNPVASLISNVNNYSSDQFKEYLRIVYSNASRLSKLVQQLIDIRKIEAGSQKFEPNFGNLAEFLENLYHSFIVQAKERAIDYKFSSPNELYCIFDSDKLEKIVTNLLFNAFKFTPDGGKINLSAELKENSLIIVEVKDTGIGIEDQQLPMIFEPFFRGGDQKTEGAGIGLALSRELAIIHGGSIEAKSQVKTGINPISGSVFSLSFPYKTKAEKHISFNPEEINSLPLISIIDDNTDILNFLENELKPEFQVRIACNGNEGILQAYEIIPDLIISDVRMDDILGFELCEQLKNDDRTSHVPIILLTGMSENEQRIKGFDSGADDYITKPFNIEILKHRIKSLINQRKSLIKKFTETLHSDKAVIHTENIDQKFLIKLMAYIEDEFSNPDLDVEKMASAMGMSRAQLYRKVQAVTGQSVKDFIRVFRLKKAIEYISIERINISEASLRVGFIDVSSFTKAFTRQFGQPPSRYLK